MPNTVNPIAVEDHEFPAQETHGIARLQNNRLVVCSEGLGWKHLYASLACEQPWTATVRPVQHYCLAYCLHRSAHITRRLPGGVTHAAQLRPRQFGTIPQDIESHWNVQGSPQVLLLYLRRSLMESVVEQVYEKDAARAQITPILGTPDPLLEQLAAAILDTLRHGQTASALYIESLTHTVATHLLHRYGLGLGSTVQAAARKVSLSAPGLQRVVDYIDAALDQDLGLKALAQQAGYSEHFFARAFQKHMGMPPHQFVLDRRIHRAKQLLVQSDLPLVQIALNTGFSSQSHLSSTFQRLTGVTPGVYRKG